ncbi:MAG: hypothetical protein ACTSR7_07695 [Promethearchaeota archaeon]
MLKKKIFLIFIIGLLLLLVNSVLVKTKIQVYSSENQLELPTSASWLENGSIITTLANDQEDSQICKDGVGGAIITWVDHRMVSGLPLIFAQRIDTNGTTLWNSNGIIVSVQASSYAPRICSDGAGGAIIVWYCNWSGPDYDIYAQKIDSDGNLLWNLNGTNICSASNSQMSPEICSDGAGGAIIAWRDFRSTTSWDLYSQSVDSSGAVQWAVDGISICSSSFDQSSHHLISDGNGGAIIIWDDIRNGSHFDIYTQRVDATGTVLWGLNGMVICNLIKDQQYPEICSDGMGGAIITWFDYVKSNISQNDIFAQRIDLNGAIQWSANGIVVCGAINDQWFPYICSDGLGGAIITWRDNRNGIDFDIFAQKINTNGNIEWVLDGILICGATNNQFNPCICSNGVGGAYITWVDNRSGIDYDIYAQFINLNGKLSYVGNGKIICAMNHDQINPELCNNGVGSALITWTDGRNGSFNDIYAQFISREYSSLIIIVLDDFLIPFIITLIFLVFFIAISSQFINLTKIRMRREIKKNQKKFDSREASDQELFDKYLGQQEALNISPDNIEQTCDLLRIEKDALVKIEICPLEFQQEIIKESGKPKEFIINSVTNRELFTEFINNLETEGKLTIEGRGKTNPANEDYDILTCDFRNFKSVIFIKNSRLEFNFALLMLEFFIDLGTEVFGDYFEKLTEIIIKHMDLKLKGRVKEIKFTPKYFSIVLKYFKEKWTTKVLAIKRFQEKVEFHNIMQSIAEVFPELNIFHSELLPRKIDDIETKLL